MRAKCISTGVTIEQDILEELDKRRREISYKEGKDLPRSAYICQLLRRALEHEKKGENE